MKLRKDILEKRWLVDFNKVDLNTLYIYFGNYLSKHVLILW